MGHYIWMQRFAHYFELALLSFFPLWTRLEHQHGRRFIFLEHQYGRRDVM